MKRKYIVFVLIAFLFFSGIMIYKKTKINNVPISYVLENNNQQKVCAFYVNDNKVYGVFLPQKSDNQYDLINEVYEYMTTNKNYAPAGYKSYLSNSSKLLYYKILNDTLTIHVDSNFMYYEKGKEEYIVSCLYESYKLLGYSKLNIEIEGYSLETFGNVLLNGKYETLVNNKVIDLVNSKAIRVYRYIKENILSFDNYYTKNEDQVLFIVNKILEPTKNKVPFEENKLNEILVKDDEIEIYFENEILGKSLLESSLSLSLNSYKISLKTV